MAIHESEREDLMREATAFGRRTEFFIADHPDAVFVGFRDDGRVSIYWGSDPVHHFDTEGRLRRSYVDGQLYRTQGLTLARLTRQRSAGASELVRHDLSQHDLQGFLETMDRQLAALAEHIRSSHVQQQTQIPAQPDLLPMVLAAVQRVLNSRERLAPLIKS